MHDSRERGGRDRERKRQQTGDLFASQAEAQMRNVSRILNCIEEFKIKNVLPSIESLSNFQADNSKTKLVSSFL
jgi:hypothetical protein